MAHHENVGQINQTCTENQLLDWVSSNNWLENRHVYVIALLKGLLSKDSQVQDITVFLYIWDDANLMLSVPTSCNCSMYWNQKECNKPLIKDAPSIW